MLVVEAMAEELSRRGVKYVFGIPGKESVRLGVELQRRGVVFFSTRHETQAVMMADGLWRASGQIGVVLLAQGAGFANAVSGMVCAAKARSGVVVISGDLLMSDADLADPSAYALQNLKGVNPRIVCEGVGMRYIRPKSATTIMEEFRDALDLAQTGVAISLVVPSDLFSKHAADGWAGAPVSAPLQAPVVRPDPADVEMVADVLCTDEAASRPIILAGRGAVRAQALPALRELGDRTGALLATSLLGRSSFRNDAYGIGVCGTFSTPVAGQYLQQADCILVFGASLNPFTTYGRTVFSKKAHVIHIDREENALGRYVPPEFGVCADARLFAEALVAELDGRGQRRTGFRTAEVAAEIAGYDPRSEFNDKSANGLIDPRTLMVRLNEILPRERLLVVDAGMHLHYACTFLEVQQPQDFIFPIDSLAVGLGLGAAVGASAARQDKVTVLEVGDGGFMMALGDLETAVRFKLPMIVIVSNDQAWGAEAQHLQHLNLPDDYVRMPTPSLAAVATAMGAEGLTIASPVDLETLEERLGRPLDGPLVLDCRIDPQIQPASFNFDYAGVFAK